jgi:protein ImuA
MDTPSLAGLTAAGQLWQGRGRAARSSPPLATGHAPLDRLLGGGWPLGCLLEVLALPPGGPELPLFLPALARLAAARRSRPVVLVAPPHVPYAPACAQYGLDPAQLLVIDPPPGRAPAAPLWAMEELLAAGACAAVLAWPLRASPLGLRRLQLAARAAPALAVVVRPGAALPARSPATLRLAVTATHQGLAVRVLRNRFGATGEVALPLQ